MLFQIRVEFGVVLPLSNADAVDCRILELQWKQARRWTKICQHGQAAEIRFEDGGAPASH